MAFNPAKRNMITIRQQRFDYRSKGMESRGSCDEDCVHSDAFELVGVVKSIPVLAEHPTRRKTHHCPIPTNMNNHCTINAPLRK